MPSQPVSGSSSSSSPAPNAASISDFGGGGAGLGVGLIGVSVAFGLEAGFSFLAAGRSEGGGSGGGVGAAAGDSSPNRKRLRVSSSSSALLGVAATGGLLGAAAENESSIDSANSIGPVLRLSLGAPASSISCAVLPVVATTRSSGACAGSRSGDGPRASSTGASGAFSSVDSATGS